MILVFVTVLCSHLNTMNKHSSSLAEDQIYEVGGLIEVVSQGKTVEVDAGNSQELDTVGPIESLLGVDQTPTF